MLELLINQDKDVKTIMLIENGILVERHEEHKDEKRLEGNIYVRESRECSFRDAVSFYRYWNWKKFFNKAKRCYA